MSRESALHQIAAPMQSRVAVSAFSAAQLGANGISIKCKNGSTQSNRAFTNLGKK
jgi:hypothetical protein